MLNYYLLLFIILITTLTPSEGAIIENAQWKKLLYFNNVHSQAVQNDFFLTSDGHKNSQQELHEFTKQVQAGNREIICRFPARYAWVAKNYPSIILRDFNFEKNCLDTWKFLEAVKGVSTAVVFASYYLNNPASIFGHTFLYISKSPIDLQKNSTPYEMLDSAVSYGADTGDAGAIRYFFGGLGGDFTGTTAVLPYFFQVRLYNDFESRDLWKFYLNLTPEETDFLVRHLWELKMAKFPYYFLSKNCSYQLLAILDIIRPELELTKKIPFYVIPIDTIRLLEKEKMIVKSEFSPSARFKFVNKRSSLGPAEKVALHDFIEHNKSIEGLSTDSQRVILDTAIDYFDFRYAKEVIGEEPHILKLKNPILIKRAKLGGISPENPYLTSANNPNPGFGHPSGRFSLSAGEESKEKFLKVKYRFAAHDLLDPPLGYLPRSTLEVGDLQFQIKKKKLEIEKITAMHFSVLDPWEDWRTPLSWSMRFGGERYQKRNGDSWFDTGLYPQIGMALQLKKINFTTYAFAGPMISHRYYHNEETSHHLGVFGAQFNLGAHIDLPQVGRLLANYNYQSYSDDQYDFWKSLSIQFQGECGMAALNYYIKTEWLETISFKDSPNWEVGIHYYF